MRTIPKRYKAAESVRKAIGRGFMYLCRTHYLQEEDPEGQIKYTCLKSLGNIVRAIVAV